MKQYLVIVILSCLALPAVKLQAQMATPIEMVTANSHQNKPVSGLANELEINQPDYWARHRTYKTAGWIALGTGVPLTLAGFVVAIASVENPNVKASTAGWMVAAGGFSTLASIPLFILAGKYKRKARAMRISWKMDKTDGAFCKRMPALGLSIEW
jgi:hypothetical protein